MIVVCELSSVERSTVVVAGSVLVEEYDQNQISAALNLYKHNSRPSQSLRCALVET